jgi:hypothetical protein
MKKILFFPLLFFALQVSAINPWQKTDLRAVTIDGERRIVPDRYITLALNVEVFLKTLSEIKNITYMDMPSPEGKFYTYRISESPCMEKELADKYPNIRTYTAVCVSNPNITAKIDFTSKGFHAMVFDESGTYYIDPFASKNIQFYTCYYKKDYHVAGKHLECKGDYTSEALRQINNTDNTTALVSDNKKRILRLALSCTIEYSKAVDGPNPTKEGVLSAMVTSLNRINGIYEKELSIHMNLVANNDTLIFLANDPFSNLDGFAMLNQNQNVIDNRIKNANYDIGHVFSTGGGGIAGLGVVCLDGEKANGVTGSPDPVGDAYDVDYVAHEMGHQFGANHTFNAGTGSCSGNRNASTAYEIGSGTTIMSYAGICNNNDIALHSDDYFHRISLLEIMDYISSTSCAQIEPSNSIIPQVENYSATYYIPYITNFELPAFATDPDGDAINYCWEQSDLGPQVNWNNANNTKAPLFRSFLPTLNNVRIFPTYEQIINNVVKYKGEVLPELTRDVKFKCTVRENRNGWGQFNAPEHILLLKVITTPSLFRVTNFVQDTLIMGNTTQTVKWDTTTTTQAPISCSNVNIYLSLDSASTFPILLASNTPNDGIEIVTIPDVYTQDYSARIKVKAVNNVFFDYNNGRIKIEKSIPQIPLVDFSLSDTSLCSGESLIYTSAISNPYDSLKWTFTGTNPNQSTLNSGTVTFTSAGTYNIMLTAYKNAVAYSKSRTVIVNPLPNITFTPSNPSICSGETILISAQYVLGASCIWNTSTTTSTIEVAPTESTTYSVEITDANVCKNTDSITVNVKSPTQSNIYKTLCSGDTLFIGSTYYTEAGNYTAHLLNNQGCDSSVEVHLSILPISEFTISKNICTGDSMVIGSQAYYNTGNYTQILQNYDGCDSIVHLELHTESPPTMPVITSKNDTLFVTNLSANSYIWFLNGMQKASTSTPYIATSERGQWTVVAVTQLGCESSASTPYVITSVKNNFIGKFNIIPNPNTGSFSLELQAEKDIEITYCINNILGEQIFNANILLKKGINMIPIDISGNAKGMYILNIMNQDINTTKTFTID